MTTKTRIMRWMASALAAVTMSTGCGAGPEVSVGAQARPLLQSTTTLTQAEADRDLGLGLDALIQQQRSEIYLPLSSRTYLGVAEEGRRPVLYERGASVSRADDFYSCTKELSCSPINPDPIPWDCDYEEGGNTCECIGIIDCIAMALSYACSQPMDCPENSESCYCVGHGNI